MDLPAQAMSCMISGLGPADVSVGWKPNDGSLLAEVATNKVLHAVVKVSTVRTLASRPFCRSVGSLLYCWLGHQTCKNRRPYNLYCVGADVKPCSISQCRLLWMFAFHRLSCG